MEEGSGGEERPAPRDGGAECKEGEVTVDCPCYFSQVHLRPYFG